MLLYRFSIPVPMSYDGDLDATVLRIFIFNIKINIFLKGAFHLLIRRFAHKNTGLKKMTVRVICSATEW